MAYWLIKSEPSAYSWDQLVKDKKTSWTGVRNFQAQINLKAMKTGDRAFFYHSGEGNEIVDQRTAKTVATGHLGNIEILEIAVFGRDPGRGMVEVDGEAADLALDQRQAGLDRRGGIHQARPGGGGDLGGKIDPVVGKVGIPKNKESGFIIRICIAKFRHHARRARMRAQERMPLCKLSRSYFSFGA